MSQTSPTSGASSRTRVPGRPPAWMRRLRRHRQLLAAALAGLVVWSVAGAVRPPDPATVEVVVAAADLRPGTVLTPDDLRIERRPGAPEDGAAAAGSLTGRTVAFPVRAGEPLLERHVLGADLLAGYGAGTVATALPLSDDDVLTVVAAGDLVDVLAATASDLAPAAATVVARGVRVLLAPAPGTAASGLLGADGSAGSNALVVAATSEQALAIAAASVRSRLSVVLRGRS